MPILDLDGVKLYYEDRGNEKAKSAVAFLNGVMASTNSWDFISPVFEEMGFRVIRHDFRGQLKSDKPAGPYSFAQHAGDAKALFESLGIQRVHLVGTSYGSEVGMKFAILYPEMVQSLTVIDGVSELDEVLRGFIDSWTLLCELGDGEKFFRGMTPSIYGNSFIREHGEMLDQRAKACRLLPPDYLEGQKILYETFEKDVYMTDELHKIQAPTLVIVGQEDILKRVKFSDIIAREIPDTEYVILPDCGHVGIFEKYGTLNTLLTGFLCKHDGNCRLTVKA
ncbi:alpha/beta fold hydrolase [Papillibacter cinnamivorans]|uniref:3-oxoadipate enol-lactonase n=1 Tax=Papillibacter cinnamivorans DSM 12816 TaxID=1122930 RepID=A0A1W2CLQ2_9FIRM|nr:alpha/beta hydrolase [Papillibacter cinnamivorans]SMC85812.1 3-oxoadipate enol-lactonase [Papillibacter cinnamivorans DSM 12816]